MVDEIKITPEMAEAGAEEMLAFDGGFYDTHEEWARRVYRAMERARMGLPPEEKPAPAPIVPRKPLEPFAGLGKRKTVPQRFKPNG